jgi:leucyl-tRNA synthetase
MPSSENPKENPNQAPQKEQAQPSEEEVERLERQLDVLERLYSEFAKKCSSEEWDSFDCAVKAKLLKSEIERFVKMADDYINRYCSEPSEDCTDLKEAKAAFEEVMTALEYIAGVARLAYMFVA